MSNKREGVGLTVLGDVILLFTAASGTFFCPRMCAEVRKLQLERDSAVAKRKKEEKKKHRRWPISPRNLYPFLPEHTVNFLPIFFNFPFLAIFIYPILANSVQ